MASPRLPPAAVAVGCGAGLAALAWLAGTIAVAAPSLTRRRGRPNPAAVRIRSLDGLSLAATYLPGAGAEAPGVLIEPQPLVESDVRTQVRDNRHDAGSKLVTLHHCGGVA